MSRIVAGSAGGRTIKVPPRGTRPTSEKVREALFSLLEHRAGLDGAHVLDLYAGSGALALEAASRGAQAVAVESDAGACRVIRANAAALGLAIEVRQARVERFLAGPPPAPDDGPSDPGQAPGGPGRAGPSDPSSESRAPGAPVPPGAASPPGPVIASGPFSIVLADPPYALGSAELAGVLAALDAPGWLAPGAIVVIERDRRSEPVAGPPGWEPLGTRRYGETELTLWRAA